MTVAADFADATPTSIVIVDENGRRWRLGFNHETNPPTAVWIAEQTWGYMKEKFATWAEAKATRYSFGAAKVI